MTTCQRCGACCSGHLIVEADALDCLREPRLLAADTRLAQRGRPLTLEDLLADDGKVVLLACGRDHPCKWLCYDDDLAVCSIYPTRPNTCVAFEPGSDQCIEARAADAQSLVTQESP